MQLFAGLVTRYQKVYEILGSKFICIKMHLKWNYEYQTLSDRIHNFHAIISINLEL
jgi:hypothetical protein